MPDGSATRCGHRREARLRKRSASDLIREAMGTYLEALAAPDQPSLLEENEPASVGEILNLPETRSEWLDDFLERE